MMKGSKGNFNNILRKIRTTVSADKQRYCEDDFDVDLTYITDRLIAMSLPAEGVEATYRNDINEVSALLRLKHPDHFQVYNLSQRVYDHSKFDSAVITCYEWQDHHAPPLLLLFEAVDSMHKFLKDNHENVVVVHCLAGKGRTGTLIACYMMYAGLFKSNVDARNYFAARRSVTNWGVAGPAQIRYVEYFENILANGPPKFAPTRLISITMYKSPNMSSLGRSGFTPLIYIFDQNSISQRQLLIWSNSKNLRTIPFDQTETIFDVNVVIQGDIIVLLRHKSWGEDKLGMLAFNTAMEFRDNPEMKVRFMKYDIDIAYNDKRFPDDFYLEFKFESVPQDTPLTVPLDPNITKLINNKNFWRDILETHKSSDGSICFKQDDQLQKKLQEAKNFTCKSASMIERGGWLTKQGHKVKNWKRRWFVLHPDRLDYYKKPNSLAPIGRIYIKDIAAVQAIGDDNNADPGLTPSINKKRTSADEISQAPKYNKMESTNLAAEDEDGLDALRESLSASGINFSNAFVIYAQNQKYCCYADHEQDREEWVDAITYAIQLWEEKEKVQDKSVGKLLVSVRDANNLPKQGHVTKSTVDPYAVIIHKERQYRTETVLNNSTPKFNPHHFEISIQKVSPPSPLTIQVWDEHTFLSDELLGEFTIPLDQFSIKTTHEKIKKKYSISSKGRPPATVTVCLEFIPNSNANGESKANNVDGDVKVNNQSTSVSASSPRISETRKRNLGVVHKPDDGVVTKITKSVLPAQVEVDEEIGIRDNPETEQLMNNTNVEKSTRDIVNSTQEDINTDTVKRSTSTKTKEETKSQDSDVSSLHSSQEISPNQGSSPTKEPNNDQKDKNANSASTYVKTKARIPKKGKKPFQTTDDILEDFHEVSSINQVEKKDLYPEVAAILEDFEIIGNTSDTLETPTEIHETSEHSRPRRSAFTHK